MSSSNCWICGGPSETAEHRIKKSDIVHQFGPGPYRADETLRHFRGDSMRLMQGPDSTVVKYAKNLCGPCNSSFTQPFDKAYETFVAKAMEQRQEILERRVIDFESIYGAEWENGQRNLFKYFAKCFGCRLDEADRTVPQDVVALLSKDVFTTALYATFMVNEDFHRLRIDHVGSEPLIVHRDRATGSEVGFQCGHAVGWLTMMYWYRHFPLEPIGSRWIANAKHVYLGWHRPLGSAGA